MSSDRPTAENHQESEESTVEVSQCPYCEDGELRDDPRLDDHIKHCSNGAACPATFVLELEGGGSSA